MKSFDLSVYLILGPENCQVNSVQEVVKQALQGGVTFIQLRSKIASAKEMIVLAKEIADEITEQNKEDEVKFVINDRVDLVWAAQKQNIKVDGVHLGQSDLDPVLARELLGEDAIIGLSAHLSELIQIAGDLPAGTLDYLGAGPVHETPTKPDCGLTNGKIIVQGVEGVNKLAQEAHQLQGGGLPVVAGGGVKLEDVKNLAQSEVDGFFVVTAITDSPDHKKSTHELAEEWKANRDCKQ